MTTTTTKSVQELTAKIAEYTKISDLTISAWSGKVLAVRFSGGKKTTTFAAQTLRLRRLMKRIGYSEEHFSLNPSPDDVLDASIVRDFLVVFERDNGWAELVAERAEMEGDKHGEW